MTKEEIFSIWAPSDSPWTRWVKPVLFAYLDSAASHLTAEEPAPDVSWAPRPAEKTALVLDLPGAEGVVAGIALASLGYRPIPLYNALPLPFGARVLDPLSHKSVAAVNVLPILAALRSGVQQLVELTLPPEAPPAFLLDANRAGEKRKMPPGEFDNRSICFTTDFPSGTFLASQGIQRVILVQKSRIEPRRDVAHTLCAWQDGGLLMERKHLDLPGPPERFRVPRPAWYRMMFQRALAGFGLRRSGTGGFGAWVPDAAGGG